MIQVPIDPKRDVLVSDMLPLMRPYCPCEPMDSEVGPQMLADVTFYNPDTQLMYAVGVQSNMDAMY